MGGSAQARRVRVITDGDEVERHLVGFENYPGAADDQFADAAGAETAADGQARSVAPRLQLQKATDHTRNVLGEILDRPLHNPGCLGFADCEQLIEEFFVQIFGRTVAERIFALLAQQLAQMVDDLAERALGDAIAEKSVLVTYFDV